MNQTENPRIENLDRVVGGVLGIQRQTVTIRTRSLKGGLESGGVSHITAHIATAAGRPRVRTLICKRLPGGQSREARVYREILTTLCQRISPTMIGVRESPDESWLFMEAIRPSSTWPWQEPGRAGAVLSALARLHTSNGPTIATHAWLEEWAYERELTQRASALVEAVGNLPAISPLQPIRDSAPQLRRLARELPRWREWLLRLEPFGTTFIHGDVHPGNVMMRRRKRALEPVLLDWGRSRMGSPLEDVGSWLQSLGYWEPRARQKHDSLLMEYLRARGLAPRLSRELRDGYWLAAASNLLAGAILHHLSIATGAKQTVREREAAIAAARDGLRVIRRADACWLARASHPGGGGRQT